jgi:polyisoprenoid-binding protein YceI
MKKRIIFSCLFILFGIFIVSAQNAKLGVESNHSTIGFAIPIAGGATVVTGKFMDFDLELHWRNDDLAQSRARFTIQARSINTGIPSRDEHLRSTDFFDVDLFPEIIFQSRSIEKKPDGSYLAKGILSMHGVDKLIDLPFRLVYEEGNTLGFAIRSSINRLDFGVGEDFRHSAIENFLGEEVELQINFWTQRAREG